MKIALVHDYLREYGGAERVVEALHEMWPEAPLYTSFVDWSSFAKAPKGKVEVFKSMDIRTSWVQHNPLVKKFISPLRFLAPAIWRSFDLSGYDVVISSSGWFMCRGVALAGSAASLGRIHVAPPEVANENLDPSSEKLVSKSSFPRTPKSEDGQNFVGSPSGLPSHTPLHISYIHHPPRNLYGYATGSDWQKYWPVRVYGTIVNFFLRHYDFAAAQAVDYFVANSRETARRVEKFYRRESTVIYPPVEVISDKKKVISKATNLSLITSHLSRSYYLSVGRLTYAKRVDLAIEAANRLKVPLKIVGTGKEETYLRSIAGPNVEFLGSVSDEELSRLYAGAKALIFCALDEDFGMVAVEAQAAGIPVIALGQGGALETIVNGKTGILFDKPEVKELMKTMQQFDKLTIQPKDCIAQAAKFGKERFKRELEAFIESVYTPGIPIRSTQR